MPSGNPKRGEIWRVDLGLAGKVRPALVLSIPCLDHERALHIVMLHTTTLRGTRFEIQIPHRALQAGAFDAQQILAISPSKFMNRIGYLSTDEMFRIEKAIVVILALPAA